jgi:hypothetical protein
MEKLRDLLKISELEPNTVLPPCSLRTLFQLCRLCRACDLLLEVMHTLVI